MGSWSIWYSAAFIIIALIAALSGRRGRTAVPPARYGGWLVVISIFLVFWAAQELAEFYRVKNLIEILVPSALESPKYHEYMAYAQALAWFEASLLFVCVLLLVRCRSAWAVKAVIASLWVAGPLCAVIEFTLAQSYFGDYLVEDDFSAIAATTLFAITLSWYLLVSKRVRNRIGAETSALPT